MMERMITVGLTLLLVSLTAPNTKAETKSESQPQQPQPVQVSPQPSVEYSTNSVERAKAESTTQAKPVKLSERDRIIREYQTQTIIPAQ
ncbi:hypothetical protein K9N68_11195 [Kovacikia minuta CCNUW1]|uniref:hypothetical protein n=1 Tax=Kovacikia minuta TaxID=2931930 RepID=UPI001CCBD399|nr:hypothetical protein [Kovacikia minuta]UBF28385.1 hypothetical protein K9N68_11195 [Kovacikia minuta CCNUW1]